MPTKIIAQFSESGNMPTKIIAQFSESGNTPTKIIAQFNLKYISKVLTDEKVVFFYFSYISLFSQSLLEVNIYVLGNNL